MKPRFPGEKSQRYLDEFQKYVIVEPYPFVLDLEQCRGMWLATVDDQKIFDWAGYYASKLIGHNHPHLSEPSYLKRLALMANNKIANPDFLTPECVNYYRLLYRLAPQCMVNPKLEVYAVNSGAEAVENMMKYFINLHKEKMQARGVTVAARRFIYFDQAFHGRTVFALNVTQIEHDPVVTHDFHGLVPGNIQVPFPAIDADDTPEANRARTSQSLATVETFLKRYGDEVVGIVVEPLQGAGGHRVAEPEFFRGLSELAERYQVYLGFDEVQTAGGQLGTMFAADLLKLPHPPSAIATAKKFGNGVVYMHHTMNDHGVLDSTWGGSLTDMVRFGQEMEVVESEDLVAQVPQKAARLVAGLQALAKIHAGTIRNIRGWGLYQGFSLGDSTQKNALIETALEQENLLLLGAGPLSIRFRPVLDVSQQDIDLLLEKLNRILPLVGSR
jgi:L-lysine 6-transaminase